MISEDIFDVEGPIFIGAKREYKESSIGIIGANYDGTTSYKPGTRFGPHAIRHASQCLETYCPKNDKDLLEINYCDLGSIKIGSNDTKSVIHKVKLGTEYLLQKGLRTLLLGGEHSITVGAIEAFINKYPNLILIQLDAHADLRDSYQGNRYSHACTMQRCVEILPRQKILQIGIRSGTKEEYKIMNKNKQLIDLKEVNYKNYLLKKLNQFKDSPIYLTLDLDWFDPSLLSGTGTPEPGGFFWRDFENIIEILSSFHIVGADIVELSPDIDPSGLSSVVAAKVVRTLIMTLDKSISKALF
tara:strand:- start:8792 stop:9691 length:900 start_codon:yes stop_codon:yes gene_type:complete